MHHSSSGYLIADVVSGVVTIISLGLAFFGHLTVELKDVAYVVSISAGLFTILFGYLNYRLNKKKSTVRPFKKRKK